MRKIIFIISFGLIISVPAYAKWAPIADAPTRNSYVKEITVNDDGTYESIEEVTKIILTEVGRSEEANTMLYYNGDSEKINLLEAKTIYKGNPYKLDRSLIEDKPLASSPAGFDQYRQLLLAFPKTEKGAKVSLKYKFTLKKTPIDNFYADYFRFGGGELVASSRVKITSKLPLYVKVNDPEHYLRITKSKTKESYNLEIVLTKEIYKAVTNEPGDIVVSFKHIPSVSVSTIDNWENFGRKQAALTGKIYHQKLPQDFEQILKVAQSKTDEVEQINTVTSLLNDKIRYMGDWRTVSGRYVPRDLDKIAKTQLGDCKDFSAGTVAILTKLGFKAQVALTMRGLTRTSYEGLPGFYAFNHAIVKATGKNGKVYWIDPTNFESMAWGIFPDIARKKVLVLDEKNPIYETIPEVNFERAGIKLKRELKIINNNKVIEKGSLVLQNECTLGLIGSALKVSTDAIKNAIFYVLAGGTSIDEKDKKRMELPKLNSRIVKDISVNYSFERENEVLQTNAGPALKLAYNGIIPNIYNISQDNVADILIDGFPVTMLRQTIIKDVAVNNIESLNKKIDTAWLSVKRTCIVNQDHNLQIDESIVLHKNLISSEEFRKSNFIALKKWLKRNFNDVIIVFK
jgi:predicted transglutaminase-like cysteine proteinase